MTRQEAINIIEDMFPPDSHYERTANLGKSLLEQAKKDCSTWRNEPENVLIRFAELCIQEDNRQARIQENKYK